MAMGGYLAGDDTQALGGGAAAAQQDGPNDAAVNYVLSTLGGEEKVHVVLYPSTPKQAALSFMDGTAAPLSGQVQHTDSGAHNSPPGLEIDLEANHPVPTVAVYVWWLFMFFDFIVKQAECVGSRVRNCCTGEELQERCYKYSQKALGFETCTFIASCFAAPVVSSTGSITILIVASAGLLVAISIELFSLTTKKTKLGRGSVYLSSSLVMLTTFLMFISFDKRYAYGILSVLPLIVAVLFRHKLLLPAVHDNEEATQEELDNIFDIWAIILNLGGFVTLIFTYNMQAEYSSASVTGFLFMFTIFHSFFEMMVAAARPVALARLATYLHYPLMFLFVVTLTSTLVTAAKMLDSSG